MSSKRGRKRNDNLPPNRARDIQRAFRARRAAHLEALEQRVTELEEENNALRAALNLPPANRPSLGKGPTGKDKPKQPTQQLHSLQIASASATSTSSLPPISHLPTLSPTTSLPPMSRADSPSSTSTRTTSLSPTNYNAALENAQPITGLDPATWDDLMPSNNKDQPEPSSSSSTMTTYTIPPVPGPSHSPTYHPRQTLEDMYMNVSPNYTHTADRSMTTAGDPYSGTNSNFLLRDERRGFSYSQPTFPTHAGQMHSPVSSISPTLAPQTGGLPMSSSSLSFTHRRSFTEPHGGGSGGYRPPNLSQMPSIPQMRLPQPPPHPHPLRVPSPSQQMSSPGAGAHPGYQVSGERRLDRMR